jgi:uncharacterized protein (TIGR03084 family)
VDPRAIVDDLEAEEDGLGALLDGLGADAWALPTPAEGWTVLDQVAHLAEGEELAASAIDDPDAFAAHLALLLADLDATAASMAERARALSPRAARARWDEARRRTLDGLRRVEPGARVAWVTGPMSVASFATARLMETWAHGQDIADAAGVDRTPTARLRHIAHLGVSTRDFSFRNRGLDPPPAPVRVELVAPDGGTWTWGPVDAAETVTGSAVGFCLVVTQRRRPEETDVVAHGAGAAAWLAIAQAFAGPPTTRPLR